MERQLKERLIGAAVLFALAVVLVPEMFTGAARHQNEVTSTPASDADASSAGTAQEKKWSVNLGEMPAVSAASSSVAADEATNPMDAPPIEPPAALPADEIPPVVTVATARNDNASPASTRIEAAPGSPAENVASVKPSAPVAKAELPADSRKDAKVESPKSSVSSALSSPTVASATDTKAAGKTELKASTQSDTKSETNKEQKSTQVAANGNKEKSGAWQIQVGSFSTEAKARQVVAQLKSKGHAGSISQVQVKDKTLFRVRVTAGDSRDAATVALKKLTTDFKGASLVAPGKP